MKRVLLLGVLLLSACSPALQQAAKSDLANLAVSIGLQYAQNEKATLSADAKAVTFYNGDTTVAKAVVVAFANATTADVRCQQAAALIVGCKLGDVKPGVSVVIAFTGGPVTRGNATLLRDSAGPRPLYLQLR